jgi:hypothetical protein
MELPNTQTNLRLLNYAGIIQSRLDNSGFDCKLYDRGFQHSIGKLKIEKPIHHLNNAKKGRVPCYYLSGISNFFQDVKDRRLRDIDLGGERSFTFTGFNFADAGFWAHITTVLNTPAGVFDYAFFPVWNDSFDGGLGKARVVNHVKWNAVANRVEFSQRATGHPLVGDSNPIVPFPYLKYVLEQAAAYVGWKIQGAILSDPGFREATMINFKAIDWSWVRFVGSGLTTIKTRNPVKFDLGDHLPDISIAEFFLSLKNRLGWWYDFDRKNKVIIIKPLIDESTGNIKNFSKYANPLVPKKVNKEKKTYALKNSNSSSSPDYQSIDLQADVATIAALPAAAETTYGHVHYVIVENSYYICRQDDTTGVYSWELYAANIYDYAPAGANEDINSTAITAGNEKFDAYMDFIPHLEMPGIWPLRTEFETDFPLALIFFKGLRNNKAGTPYPFATSGIYDSTGAQCGNWALTYTCKKLNGDDVGLYQLNFKKFLDTLNTNEEFEVTLNLPLVEWLLLHFSDIIVINGVKMYITKVKSTLPYNNSVLLETSRI